MIVFLLISTLLTLCFQKQYGKSNIQPTQYMIPLYIHMYLYIDIHLLSKIVMHYML